MNRDWRTEMKNVKNMRFLRARKKRTTKSSYWRTRTMKAVLPFLKNKKLPWKFVRKTSSQIFKNWLEEGLVWRADKEQKQKMRTIFQELWRTKTNKREQTLQILNENKINKKKNQGWKNEWILVRVLVLTNQNFCSRWFCFHSAFVNFVLILFLFFTIFEIPYLLV